MSDSDNPIEAMRQQIVDNGGFLQVKMDLTRMHQAVNLMFYSAQAERIEGLRQETQHLRNIIMDIHASVEAAAQLSDEETA